jgi:8-oxo-dGTP diphosphatase
MKKVLKKIFDAIARRHANDDQPRPYADYLKSLPRKIAAAGFLVMKDDKMMVLETGYQKGLNIPGGVVEANEAPYACAVREAREEIGINIAVKGLLCVDYDHNRGKDPDEGIRFVFLGDLNGQTPCPDQSEVKNILWLPPIEAMKRMEPQLARRVVAAVKGLKEHRVVYCEDGVEPVFGPSSQPPKPKGP